MRLKLFGAALIAIAAIGAVSAASVFASYHSEIEKTIYVGPQKVANVLTMDVGNLQCTTATFESGEVIGNKIAAGNFTAAKIEVHPLYGKATGLGSCTLAGIAVEVKTNECNYNFKEAANIVKGVTAEANFDLVCPAGSKIVIKDLVGLKCEVILDDEFGGVAANQNRGKLKFENLGAGAFREVEVTFELSELTYEWNANCPNIKGKAGKNTNGKYTGTVRLEGEEPAGGAQKGIWVEK